MSTTIKNKFLVSLVVMIIASNGGYVSAESKTWAKDGQGRALVYRAEPSKLHLAGWVALTGLSAAFTLGGICSKFTFPKQNKEAMFFGGIFTIAGMFGLSEWYHNYESLCKPLIIIDRVGIAYEGKDKILWKNVCSYEHERYTVYVNGVRDHDEDYVVIATDTHKIKIFEHDTAITSQMLLKLVDEGYKSYQELEKQREQAR